MGKNYAVHARHCCVIHGCKYGHDDCPVGYGEVEQQFPCIECPINIEEANERIERGKIILNYALEEYNLLVKLEKESKNE